MIVISSVDNSDNKCLLISYKTIKNKITNDKSISNLTSDELQFIMSIMNIYYDDKKEFTFKNLTPKQGTDNKGNRPNPYRDIGITTLGDILRINKLYKLQNDPKELIKYIDDVEKLYEQPTPSSS